MSHQAPAEESQQRALKVKRPSASQSHRPDGLISDGFLRVVLSQRVCPPFLIIEIYNYSPFVVVQQYKNQPCALVPSISFRASGLHFPPILLGSLGITCANFSRFLLQSILPLYFPPILYTNDTGHDRSLLISWTYPLPFLPSRR